MGLEWVAPTIAGAFLLLATLATGIIGYRTSRSGARAERAPDATEAWAETDRARHRMRIFEDLFYLMRGAFKGLARRVTEQYPGFELTPAEREALEAQPPPPDPK